MATKYTTKTGVGGKVNQGYQEGERVDEFSIPSCTVEDVDRAMFNLFEKELNFTVQSNKKPIKIPVIFATGERFALLARKKPLRDSTDALILPLISIMRTGVINSPGVGQNVPLIVKKRIAPEDARFQQYVNKQAIANDDNLAHPPSLDSQDGASEGGKKLIKSSAKSGSPSNPMIENDFSHNIMEIFEIPPVKHYTANYEITFWCQYTQQMNQVLTIFMGGYSNSTKPSYRLDTDKGYYFTAIVEDDFNPDVNFDNFSDDERLVKCTITMKVFAYLVAPRSLGQPSPIRRYVSAPTIDFSIYEGMNVVKEPGEGFPVTSSDVNDHVLKDLAHELSATPKQGVAIQNKQQIESKVDSLGTTELNNNIGSLGQLKKVVVIDPLTGKNKVVEVRVIAGQNKKSGETVFRPASAKPAVKLEYVLDDWWKK